MVSRAGPLDEGYEKVLCVCVNRGRSRAINQGVVCLSVAKEAGDVGWN